MLDQFSVEQPVGWGPLLHRFHESFINSWLYDHVFKCCLSRATLLGLIVSILSPSVMTLVL